ncbi:MAG: acyl-[acyl-carrier-protein] thioesterase [Acidobacteria bacterium]|nr:acyl-[acyl-carrier-protein] thioesterase [Acidobacteriota bacterium]
MNRIETEIVSRGYELDAGGLVPPHMLLRYMEHLRWEYVERGSPEVKALFRSGHTFVVVAQTLRAARGIGLSVRMRAILWIGRTGRTSMDFHHVFHRVKDGALLAEGITTVVYLGRRGLPTPLPECLDRVDPNPPVKLALEPPAFEVMPPGSFERSYRVRADDLDFLQHMNQAGYAAIYDDARQAAAAESAYGPEGMGSGRVRFLHIEYVQSALSGNELIVATRLYRSDPVTLGFVMSRDGACLSRAVFQV